MTAIAEAAPIANDAIAQSKSRLAAWGARLGAILRQLGPYAAIEILLPGGTLIALLLWVYRTRLAPVSSPGAKETSRANPCAAATSEPSFCTP